MVVRLCLVLCLTFKMLVFPSYEVIHRKKSTMANVHDLLIFFQIYTFDVIKIVCVGIISIVCLS